jgi:polysaccharide biosynthesis/export protein
MNRKRILYSVFAIFALCLTALPQSKTPSSSEKKQPSGPAAPAGAPQATARTAEALAEYIIGPEDVLQVNVWREPELAARVAVRPDGKIDLPLVNDIQASGLTTRQLREAITAGVRRFVPDPTVTVMVVELRSQTVSIVGAVARPGIYALGGPTPLMELVAKAGGFQDFAKVNRIQIVRQVVDRAFRFFFNYKNYLAGRDFAQNIVLQNGDVVIVP